MVPESSRLGCSQSSRLQEDAAWDAFALKPPELAMLPYPPKSSPFPSVNQLTSFFGAWKGHSPATRMPHKINRQVSPRTPLVMIAEATLLNFISRPARRLMTGEIEK